MNDITPYIKLFLEEDLGDGDHSTLSIYNASSKQSAELKVKDSGILAGIAIAEKIYQYYDSEARLDIFLKDGVEIAPGMKAFRVHAKTTTILSTERLVLNIMQRMSGIATKTAHLVDKVKHTQCKILDTRKTTPGFRYFEKAAVKIGGGYNHRFGLYDMIMLKDNHVDYAGGIKNAIDKAHAYLEISNKHLAIEIETRNLDEVKQVLDRGGVQRIMLDNFTPDLLAQAVQLIQKRFETEASGGITENTIAAYAETGVDFISVGALTHQVQSLDLSLKAV
jgi:nicotinate-nucleotide pyrophosphorylase (carboxylating)